MTLRLWLVMVVALMSFELPSGQDLESWSAGGHRWLDARTANLSQLRAKAVQIWSGDDEAAPLDRASLDRKTLAAEIEIIRADGIFETALEGVIAQFRTDLTALKGIEPVAAEPPASLVDRNEVDTPSVEPTEPICFDLETTTETDIPPSIAVESESSTDRLTSAVRLTRQALSAWASLIEGSQDDSR